MGSHGCSPSGEVDDSKFGKPLPWIGFYMAAASFLCALLMGIDTVHGFRRPQQLWFPCRFFSLNAISLTLLAVATKLPVDLNTAMPRSQDQLAKLSGTVLICTAMANFTISVGNTDVSGMISNVSALGILVVTVIVNIGIQMSTGVIYVFLPEHALITSFMLVLLLILCSTALRVAGVKEDLKITSDEVNTENEQSDHHIEKLKDDVRKSWIKVHTRNPQYVVRRFVTCTASGAFCLLSALILLQAAFKSFLTRSLHFCQGKSDYSWSTTLVLISQVIAISVGTIAPVIRWFNTTRFRIPTSQTKSCRNEFSGEYFWGDVLAKWCESWDRVIFGFVLVVVHGVALIVSTLISRAAILPMSWLSRLSSCHERRGDEEQGSEPQSRSNVDLKSFVARFYAEEDCLVDLIMTDSLKDIDHWIQKGKSKPLDYLPQLLMKSQGFHADMEFHNNQDRSLLLSLIVNDPEITACWALPLVTLTSIAITISLPNNEKDKIKSLRRGVNESLKYVRLIDKVDERMPYHSRLIGQMIAVDNDGETSNDPMIAAYNVRETSTDQMMAADIVWKSIGTHDRWLGNDLKKLAREEKTAKKILQKLEDLGKENAPATTVALGFWGAKPFAARSMRKLCRTILRKGPETADQIFESLEKTIAVMLLACLSNLRKVISRKCRIDSYFETRVMEENIREAACLVGEAENLWTKLDLSRCFNDFDHWISSQQNRDRPERTVQVAITPIEESPSTMTSQFIPQPGSTSTEDPGFALSEDSRSHVNRGL